MYRQRACHFAFHDKQDDHQRHQQKHLPPLWSRFVEHRNSLLTQDAARSEADQSLLPMRDRHPKPIPYSTEANKGAIKIMPGGIKIASRPRTVLIRIGGEVKNVSRAMHRGVRKASRSGIERDFSI